MTSKINLTNAYIPSKAEVSISANVLSSSSQSKLTYDRSYFRNKILDQYPTLYREFSSENFDYYRITDKTSCSLCKLDHDNEESIEGRYKIRSYFIKCEQCQAPLGFVRRSGLDFFGTTWAADSKLLVFFWLTKNLGILQPFLKARQVSISQLLS